MYLFNAFQALYLSYSFIRWIIKIINVSRTTDYQGRQGWNLAGMSPLKANSVRINLKLSPGCYVNFGNWLSGWVAAMSFVFISSASAYRRQRGKSSIMVTVEVCACNLLHFFLYAWCDFNDMLSVRQGAFRGIQIRFIFKIYGRRCLSIKYRSLFPSFKYRNADITHKNARRVSLCFVYILSISVIALNAQMITCAVLLLW